jgi:hypothetical protein
MTAPVIRQFVGTIPDKGQSQTEFDTNVDAFLDWQALQFAPDLVAFGTFADNTAAALVAANLPPLTGQALDAVRVNAAADGVEFADVTSFGWALMDDTSFSDMRTTLGLGTAATQTANSVGNLAIADPNHLARAGQVVTYVAASVAADSAQTADDDATLDFTWTGTPSRVEFVLDQVLPATDGTNFTSLISTDANSTFKAGASDYDWTCLGINNGTTNTIQAVDTSAALVRYNISGVGNSTGEYGISGRIEILNPAASTLTHIDSDVRYKTAGGEREMSNGFATYKAATTAVNGIRFRFLSGNITSGTITMKLHY